MAASLLNTFQCGAYPSTCDTQSGTLHMRNSHCSISPTPSSVTLLPRGNQVGFIKSRASKTKTMVVRASLSDKDPNENDNEDGDQSAADGKYNDAKDDKFRKDLERIVGKDDSAFSGIELATLIRNKYGRSYDVTLIKREFMGRNLLAMNVMWKYREQRSFPLTEEEYLLRLDDVANNLKCWGAVSHVRNSLAKVKERPRIGKAVSIFIDLDESGGRANEWIYR
uniref:DUF3067 domain-containing protein n=1 Tax=Araucaria cunninghamii TaxID=56994 RepID=A0A0D6R7D0_ARACU